MGLSPIDRGDLRKAAMDEGFAIPLPDDGEWMAFASNGTTATIRLLRGGGTYFVAVDRENVAQELATRWQALPPRTEPLPPEGFFHFAVPDTAPLQELIREMFLLARSLPSEPLERFLRATRNMPQETEVERLRVERVGQSCFREALLDFWNGTCAVTGVAEPLLLRASHIRPWAKCEDAAERLSVYNGLLLAAHVDAAFDAGLISFGEKGEMVFAERFAAADRERLGLHAGMRLRMVSEKHRERLAWHRENWLGRGWE